jgi:hypothetical protein
MTMAELLIFLATKCAFLFNPDGYRFVDSRIGRSRGDATVVLESSVLRMEFFRDRGQLLLRFQPVAGPPRDWYSLGLVQGLVTGVRPKSEVLSDEWAEFLGKHLPELEARFGDPQQAHVIVDGLREQATLRAKELFG